MSNNPNNPQQRQLRLALPTNPSGTYANMVMINQSSSEVIFDFIQIMPHDQLARIQQRIVMTPTNAKLFRNALNQFIENYEKRLGEIPVPQRDTLADQLFRSVINPEGEPDGE